MAVKSDNGVFLCSKCGQGVSGLPFIYFCDRPHQEEGEECCTGHAFCLAHEEEYRQFFGKKIPHELLPVSPAIT